MLHFNFFHKHRAIQPEHIQAFLTDLHYLTFCKAKSLIPYFIFRNLFQYTSL